MLFERGKRLAGWSNSSGRSTRNRQMLGWIRVAARATVQPAAADQPSREIGEDIVGGKGGSALFYQSRSPAPGERRNVSKTLGKGIVDDSLPWLLILIRPL